MGNDPKIVEPRENPAAPKKLKKIDRENLALELRKQGASYRRIARQLSKLPNISDKYSEGAAYKDVQNALRRLLDKQAELAEENLRIDLNRMDEMIAKLWPLAIPAFDKNRGATPLPDGGAISQLLGIIDRRARLLNYAGLYEQPKTHTTLTSLNIDAKELPTEALIRIRNGEDPIEVLTTLSGSGAGTASTAGER